MGHRVGHRVRTAAASAIAAVMISCHPPSAVELIVCPLAPTRGLYSTHHEVLKSTLSSLCRGVGGGVSNAAEPNSDADEGRSYAKDGRGAGHSVEPLSEPRGGHEGRGAGERAEV